MSDNAIISLVLGGLGIVSWLLSLSYFLGRNTAKLDGLADTFDKTQKTIGLIFDKLDLLSKAVPHRCEQTQVLSAMQTQIGVNAQRLTELESWRHSRTTKEEP